MADIFIGNVKGPQGDTGATGATGPQGDAATIAVGSTTTVPYGQAARVTNSGTSGAAVFDFVIPQGRPGEQVNKIDNLTIDAITEPSTQFPVPAVGDNGSTLFGKISKWFSDMSALVATKLNASNVVNNLTTTSSGYALDARQGKALNDAITTVNYNGSIASGYSTTVERVRVNKTLNIMTVSIVITVRASLTSSSNLATGFPMVAALTDVTLSTSAGNAYAAFLSADGTLKPNSSIPATVVFGNFTYITT